MRMALKVLAILNIGAISTPSVAQDTLNYGYFDGTALAIGQGIELRDLTLVKQSCLISNNKALDPGAFSTSLRTTFVSSENQLEQARGVDLSARASGWGASVSGSYSNHFESTFKSNRALLVITASSDFGRWSLTPGTHLDPLKAALLENPEDFVSQCGSHYVALDRRSASVSAVITLDAISETLANTIKNTFGASGKYGAVSGEVKAAFNSEIRRANRSKRVSVSVEALGGIGLGGLSDLMGASLNSENPIDDIGEKLGSFVRSFNRDNAVPTSFQLRPMTDFGLVSSAVLPWSANKNTILAEYVNKYNRYSADERLLSSVVNGSHRQSRFIDDRRKQGIQDDLETVRNQMRTMKLLYDSCKRYDGIARCTETGIYHPSSSVSSLKTQPRVLIDFPYLTPQQVKTVLSEYPTKRRATAEQLDYRLKGTEFSATVYFWGWYLDTERFVLISSEGERVGLTTSAPTYGHYTWWKSNRTDSLEDGIWSSVPLNEGDHSGSVVIEVLEKTGARFDLPFADISWSVRNRKVVAHDVEITADLRPLEEYLRELDLGNGEE